MADVFLSYSRPDQAVAEQLAEQLGAAGLTVWWDRHIEGGTDFASEIEREITLARVVVVVWSQSAVPSKWVRDEAAYARDNNKLVPVRIDETMPPFGFRQLQAIDFGQWRGTPEETPFKSLRRSIDRVLRGVPIDDVTPAASASNEHATPKLAPPGPEWTRHRRTLVAAAVVTLAAALAAAAYIGVGRSPDGPAAVKDEVEIRSFTVLPADPSRTARANAYTDMFRTRLTEMGVHNVTASPGKAPQSEFVLLGEITRDGEQDMLTIRLEDRATGATLWTVRKEPSKGAAWEANLTGYALACALKRRDPERGPELLSRFLLGCASFLDRDLQAFYAASKGAYKAAPDDPHAIAFFAVGTAGSAYLQAVSKTEHRKMMAEARRLADEALRLDPRNADAAFAKGLSFIDPQFEQQERWWRASIEADLDTGMAFGRYGNFLSTVGRMREAMDMSLRAAHDRPNVLSAGTARLFAANGDWYQARQLLESVRDFDPVAIGRNELTTYVMYGDIDTAARMLEERDALIDAQRHQCFSLLLDARRGRGYDAARFTEVCGGGYESPNLFALAGDVDGAFSQAEQFMRENELSEPLKFFGPEMRELRKDPRFWPLMARIGLTKYWLDTNQWPDYCATENVDCRKAAAAAQAALDAGNGKQEMSK